MYRMHPYEQSPSNVSYIRGGPVRTQRADLNAPTPSNNPFRLRSRAIFNDCAYYDSEETSETTSSPSCTSSSRSTPITPFEDPYRYPAPQTRKVHPDFPFSFDPVRPNASSYTHEQTRAPSFHNAPLPSLPALRLPMLPPIVAPQPLSQYHVGRALPPLQVPISVQTNPAPPSSLSNVEAHLQRLPNNQSICKWQMIRASSYPPHTCGYTARSDMVRRHIRAVHLKLKPLSCNICGVSFASKGTLETHLTRHTGAKPHPCPECGVAFNDPSKRHHHRIKEHGYVPTWRKKRASTN